MNKQCYMTLTGAAYKYTSLTHSRCVLIVVITTVLSHSVVQTKHIEPLKVSSVRLKLLILDFYHEHQLLVLCVLITFISLFFHDIIVSSGSRGK